MTQQQQDQLFDSPRSRLEQLRLNNAAALASIASFLSLQYLGITYAAKAKRDNAPAESKRSASAGAGARLALPDGKHGDHLQLLGGV